MKICFICGEYPPGPHGGIGTMTQILGRALARQGHDVRVIGVYPPDYPAPDFEVDGGVRVWRLRDFVNYSGWVASRYLLYRKVSEWARKGAIDLVEVPDYHGWCAGWRRLGVPLIVRLHGSMTYFAAELQRPINHIAFWLERSCLRRADYACSVSRYTLRRTEQVFQLPLRSSAVLYNPIDMPEKVEAPQRIRNRVIFSGTLTGKKGVIALIQAWPMVLRTCRDVELHVFGKNGRADDGRSMQSLLSSLLGDALPTVHFHGHVSRNELVEAYQSSGAAIFPSRAEAFAMAPLEAMASGCPTIYSRRGSGPELLEHERHGLLVDPDSPEQIAEAIVRILSDPSLAQRIGEAGRARVRECFSLDMLTAQNTSFYNYCLSAFRSQYSLARN